MKVACSLTVIGWPLLSIQNVPVLNQNFAGSALVRSSLRGHILWFRW